MKLQSFSAACVSVLFALSVAACASTYRPTASCEIAAGPKGGALLYRQDEDPRFRARRVTVESSEAFDAPFCQGDETSALRSKRCDNSDDLEALTGGASVVGPDGEAKPQPVCPKLTQRIVCEPASDRGPSCPSSHCPNVQLRVERAHTVAHVLFNDDPGCRGQQHRSPCSGQLQACYYRVQALALELSGEP